MSNVNLKVGDEIETTIEGIGRKGDGVGKFEGFVIMIPEAKMDRTYIVEITSIHEKFGFAKITREV